MAYENGWKYRKILKISAIDATYRCSTRGSCHKRQKPQAPTPQAPIRNRQTRKVANVKGLNRT